MPDEHLFTEGALASIQSGIDRGQSWMAFNSAFYYIDKASIKLFDDRKAANDFAATHVNPYWKFSVLHVSSVDEVFQQLPYAQKLNDYLSTLSNQSTMNEKNFEYLQKQLKLTGFGEGHTDKLKEALQQKTPEFTLFHQQDYGKDNTVATLHFRKSDTTDMYFFNRFNLLLKNEQNPDPVKQTFYINQNQSNITQKEGYNLLSGRAVEKELVTQEGNKYPAWLQLNFKEIDKHGNYMVKQFHQNYGFDLEKTVAKLPIKELGTEETKTRLLESLQRGNRQAVTLQVSGAERRAFIEAAPQFKSLNLYDEHMKRAHAQTLLAPPGEAKEAKKEAKKENKLKAGDKDDGEGPAKQKKSRSRKQGISS